LGSGATLRVTVRVGVALTLIAVAGVPALAQSFGQWTWDASAGVRRWAYRNSLGGQSIGSLDQTDVEVSLGVSGYVVHPLVGRFGLGVTAALTDTSGATAIDTRRWGVNAGLSLLPQGSYPLQLYARRQRFDYSGLTREDPLALLQTPEDATSLGGGLEVRRGWLRGVRFWVDRTELSYAGQDQTTVNESEAADWNRTTKGAQQRLRLERRVQGYGLAGLRFRDFQGNYDVRRDLGSAWRWEANANGLQRRLSYRNQESDFSFFRTSQRAYRPLRERDNLELSYDGGVSEAADHFTQSHSILARYHWRPRRELTVLPLLGYGLQLSRGARLSAPRVGIGSTWTRRVGAFDLAVSDQVSLQFLQRGGDGPQGTDTTVAFDIGGSVGRGDQSSLRADLDGGWNHNRLRAAGEVVPELPDLGVQLGSIGTEDLLKARFTLTKRLGRILAFSSSDASRREQDGRFATPAASTRSLSQTLQFSTARVSVAAMFGSTRLRTATAQEYDFVSASASLRPFRLLSLTGTYRNDHRRLDYAPDVDGERADGGARFWLGAFTLSADAFWSRERTAGGPLRENRGLIVSIRRGFGGWLPIVTAGPQGGDIR
jgi:hypothetical protein